MTGEDSGLGSGTGAQRSTYGRAGSTSWARGAGLTTHTLGTFRAAGSLGTSFALHRKQGQVRSHRGGPASPLDAGR